MKNKKNLNSMRRRSKKLVTGLIIQWTDPTPLVPGNTIANESVTHSNPMIRPYAESMWREFGKWLNDTPILLWRIDITVVFQYPNGAEQHEHRRIIARHKLDNIASECEPVIVKMMAFGNNPIETRFVVECLGDRSATEADFDDFKEVAA